MITKRVMLAVLILSLFVSPLYAASPWNQGESSDEKTLAKFKFGLKNFLFGWTELFQEPHQTYKNKGNMLDGTAKGLTNAIAYTLGGAAHLLTSPFPTVDPELPDDGVDF